MVRLIDVISQRDHPCHTYEFFPPRTEAALSNLLDRIRRLSTPPLPVPAVVSVTWGAGGSTADRSLELAGRVVKMGLNVMLHLTCTNMPKENVDHALARCRELGIQNVLALRGDPPRSEEYAIDTSTVTNDFKYAVDLVRYIRATHGDYFCIGVAGYPTPHPDLNDAMADMEYLKVKCDAGADFIVTQIFYDAGDLIKWVTRCRTAVIPGVMPIQNYASFKRLTNLTRCSVPPEIIADLEPIKADDAAVKKYGAELATKIIRTLLDSHCVAGVQFCTLNLEKSVRTIMGNLGWYRDTAVAPSRRDCIIENDDWHVHDSAKGSQIGQSISTSNADQLAQRGISPRTALRPIDREFASMSIEPDQSKEDSWDEYPNGRFTDVRSPAYGEIDGWGSGLKITALSDWGMPRSIEDLSSLFTRYLRSDPSTPTTPFCDLPLSSESTTILGPLLSLNAPERHRWTVGSQPAVDGAPSTDSMHGWGPPGGYVFQKAYVEFFTTADDVKNLSARVTAKGDGMFSLYAGNKKGDYMTNTAKDAVNAVTWAAFPGQEIVQSTMIEEISFLAWKDEAFEIWREWSLLYPQLSSARQLLDQIANEWWLVSVIHHDYKDTDGLWRFLLET